MKNIFQSKIIWVNIITFLIVIFSTSQFNDLVPESYIKIVAFINIGLTTVLRIFFTSAPITEYAAEHSKE